MNLNKDELIEELFVATTEESMSRKQLIRFVVNFLLPTINDANEAEKYLTGLLTDEQLKQYVSWKVLKEDWQDEKRSAQGMCDCGRELIITNKCSVCDNDE